MNLAIYSVVNRGYDSLEPTEWPSTCFTDGTVKGAPGWSIVRAEELGSGDPVTSSRSLKILSHRYLPRVEYSIYLDGNISLICPPEDFVTSVLLRSDIAVFIHPQRNCIYEEARVGILFGKQVDPDQVLRQVEDYHREGFPEEYGLHCCGVIIRRHTPEVKHFNELWFEVFTKYGGGWGDQLSFDYTRWRMGITFDTIPGNILTKHNRFVRRGRHCKTTKGS